MVKHHFPDFLDFLDGHGALQSFQTDPWVQPSNRLGIAGRSGGKFPAKNPSCQWNILHGNMSTFRDVLKQSGNIYIYNIL